MAQVTLSTRISPETNKLLEKYVAKAGKSKASIVEKALIEFMKKADKTRFEAKKDYEVCPGCDSKMEKEEDKNAECPNPNCDWFA